jgi:hypothetical protein
VALELASQKHGLDTLTSSQTEGLGNRHSVSRQQPKPRYAKSRITDPKRDFEPEGLKSFNGINYLNYVCSTNNIKYVNAGENDLRFCVIACNNKKAIYFMKFDSEIVRNEEAVKCIYGYLKAFPIQS